MTTMFSPLDPTEIAPGPTAPLSGADFDGVPAGYQCRHDGVWLMQASEEGDVIPKRLCSSLRVVALCRRHDRSGWARLLEVRDPDGDVHAVVLDAA